MGFTGILVVCALIITGLVLRQEFFKSAPQSVVQQVENWKQLKLTGQRIGSADAPVQIIEFFDYQCPYCKQVQASVKAVQQNYPKEVSVVHEHFPLSGHEFAFEAAIATECAGRQGRFESYHNLLFASQDSLGSISYSELAKEAQISNISQFEECTEYQETAQIITNGTDLGRKLGITGIPTFMINGKLVSGVLSEQQFEFIIKEALAETGR